MNYDSTNKIIAVEGYKAFKGKMRITPKNPEIKPFDLWGDWLYKPHTGCWYCCGQSFTKNVCTIMEVE